MIQSSLRTPEFELLVQCPACKGKGIVEDSTRYSRFAVKTFLGTCKECKGTGSVSKKSQSGVSVGV